MRFTIERTSFLAAVKRASAIIQSRTLIPVLACVKISAVDNAVKVNAYDYDAWLTATVTAAVTDPGAICIPAAQLLAWLTASSVGALISVEVKNERAILTAGRSSADFATFPQDMFPMVTDYDRGAEVAGCIPTLGQCLPYAGNEQIRHYLNGVAISSGHAIATNGHILCAVNVSADPAIAAIIPTAAVRLISRTSADARLWVGPNIWTCESEGVSIGGKLIDDTYPDWQRVIPSSSPIIATLDADAMSEAVGRVLMASEEWSRAIKIEGRDGEVVLTCRGHAATAETALPYDGTEFVTGANAKYVQTAMATMAGRVIEIAQADAGNSILITCAAAPGVRVVLMPMRL